MIPQETLEQIAAANDIVDVIGAHVQLKRAGATFKALCPFHQEKSPSFTVNPQRQRYHCFGCGEDGTVFDFVIKYENVDFPTAARRLAERAGIRIVEEERSPGEAREFQLRKRLLALHQEAAEWFHQLLLTAPEAKEARDYLKKRGMTGEVAKRWKIGYAPEGWDAFSKWATAQGYKREEILQSGLVTPRDADKPEGDFYDRFRDRVMFPICNDLGEVIAFSGRVLDPEAKAAKYINSPETPLFKKGNVLFGLHKSKRALLDKKCAIILEGQMDLITAFEAGVQNVVAPQGTAFTEKQAGTLKHYADEVILCFDADQAGRKAAERLLPALLGLDFSVRVMELPPGEDPDSLIRKEGAEAFTARVEAARDYFDFQIDAQASTPEFATPRGKVNFARSIGAVIELIKDPFLREAVLGKVAVRIGVPVAEFWRLVRRTGKTPHAKGPAAPPPRQDRAAESNEPIGGLTLLALRDPDIRRWISAQPWSARLFEMEGAELLVKILDSDLSQDDPSSLAAFSAALDPPSQALLGALLRERLPQDRLTAARDCWRALETRELIHRRDVLKSRMRAPGLSHGEITEIQKQILDLQKLLTDISRPLSPSQPE